jgi:uncharacterized tellurite resistance protein B-like protein
MEWLLLGGALVAWLVYRNAKKSRKTRSDLIQSNAPSPTAAGEPRVQFGRRDNSEWIDPRTNPDPRFGGPSQWDRSSREHQAGRAANQSAAKWITLGEIVHVAGIQISSGMFYLGGKLKSAQRGVTENCLIDPTLKVASSGGDPAGQSMSYWPSYSSIQPVARRTYLQWLAGGRTDPSIGIGYVFLFFYGLERRFFLDGAKEHASVIVDEVKRLLAIYGANNSFRGYATKLIEVATLLSGSTISRPVLSADLRSGYEISIPVRWYLGRRLNAKLPFDDKDALLWVLSLPDTYLRTAASRCFDEFVELWAIRFSERYPEGLKVNAPKTMLKLEYRAASGTFECQFSLADTTGQLPDIAAISAPIDGLRGLVNACTEELDAYSRLLGKIPTARGSIDATFLLPKELLTSSFATGTDVLRRLDDLFNGRTIAPTTVVKLIDALGMSNVVVGKLPTGTCNQIGAFLDKMDIAFEPDRRWGSRNLSSDGNILLFRAKDGAPVDSEKDAYISARAITDISVLAAAADGDIATSEYESIKTEIKTFPGLTAIERARLIAYSNTLLKDTPAQQMAIQRLKKLSDKERGKAIKSAMSAVLADGHVVPQEIKFLEKLFKALGLAVDDVYSALHRGSVVVDEPVVIAAAEPQRGIPIPKEWIPTPEGLKFDAARLERIKSETSAVSELLAGIFIEEVSAPQRSVVHTAAPVLESVPYFKGLDMAHSELLASILGSGSMARSALEDRARSLRLLPEGAIETINEWAFDVFEEPALEGEDSVAVVDHIRTELLKLKAAA